MITPKVVISLLMVSRGIIPFKEHIAAVGTTSNNMLSKRKTLDEGSPIYHYLLLEHVWFIYVADGSILLADMKF